MVHVKCTILCFLLQCVILTEASLSLQKRVNTFCHTQQPPIRVSLQAWVCLCVTTWQLNHVLQHMNNALLCVLIKLCFCFHQFISCDAYGICVRVFCDFGAAFEVSDPTGEEPKEIFIQSITQVVEKNLISSNIFFLLETKDTGYLVVLFSWLSVINLLIKNTQVLYELFHTELYFYVGRLTTGTLHSFCLN